MSSKSVKPTVLVVEDEDSIAAVIKYNLQKEGYTVHILGDGIEAVDQAKYYKPDLILLDWMLPSKSGIEVCKNLREDPETSATPIIMLSAKGEELDKVVGLERGADDYMVKPFSPAELMARIRAVLRRIRPAFVSKTLTFYDIVLDIGEYTVKRGDKEIKLAPIEFQILQILMEQPKRVLTRDALINKIWGVEVYVGTRTVDVHITRLRKALLAASKDNFDVIKTVRLAGYKLQHPQEN